MSGAGVPAQLQVEGRSRVVHLAVWGPQPTGGPARGALRFRRVLCDTLAEAQAVAVAGCAWLYAPDQAPFAKVSRIILRQGGPEDGLQLVTAAWLLRNRWNWEEV